MAIRWEGTAVIFFVGPGHFYLHPSSFSCLLFSLLFVKFVSNTFGSQPCRAYSHQREIPTTYCLCWVVLGFGLVGLGWGATARVGLDLGWAGAPLRTDMETHCFCWVALSLVGVGLG